MWIGGVVAVVVVAGLVAAVLTRQRSHDDAHSVEHYHRQLHTLQEMREHPSAGDGNGHEEVPAYPASAFRVSGSSTVRLTDPDRPLVPPVPPPPVPKAGDPVVFEEDSAQGETGAPGKNFMRDDDRALHSIDHRPRKLAAPLAAVGVVLVLIVVLIVTGLHSTPPHHGNSATATTTHVTTPTTVHRSHHPGTTTTTTCAAGGVVAQGHLAARGHVPGGVGQFFTRARRVERRVLGGRDNGEWYDPVHGDALHWAIAHGDRHWAGDGGRRSARVARGDCQRCRGVVALRVPVALHADLPDAGVGVVADRLVGDGDGDRDGDATGTAG